MRYHLFPYHVFCYWVFKMNKVQLSLIEEIEENDDKLNEWERGFIDSLTNKDDDYVLTSNQNATLNKIHHKAVWQ